MGHAELKIGHANIYLSNGVPGNGRASAEILGGSPVAIHLYVEDVDAVVARAAAAGATVARPVADQFYGDRGGKLVDPFGHVWWIATHKEDVSLEEMKVRAAKLFGPDPEPSRGLVGNCDVHRTLAQGNHCEQGDSAQRQNAGRQRRRSSVTRPAATDFRNPDDREIAASFIQDERILLVRRDDDVRRLVAG